MRYEILHPTTGAVVNTIEADEAFCEAAYPGRYRLAAVQAPTPEITERWITGVQFLRRFTAQQRKAIQARAKTDPDLEEGMFLLNATIAQEGRVNLADVDTIRLVGYLAQALPNQDINPADILA